MSSDLTTDALKEWGSKITTDELAAGLDSVAKAEEWKAKLRVELATSLEETAKTNPEFRCWPLVSNLLKYKSMAARVVSLEYEKPDEC